MKRNKLQIISHSFPTAKKPYGGIFVSDHAKAMSGNYDTLVSVITPYSLPWTSKYHENQSPLKHPDSFSTDRIKYFSVPGKRFPSLIRSSLSKNLVSHTRRIKPDIIHLHFLYASGLAIPELKKHFSCPIVLTIHGVDFYHTIRNKRLRKILTGSLINSDAIIAVGPRLHQDISEEFPDLSSKLFTIHNYVDTAHFIPPGIKKKEIIKQELGMDTDKFQLLCVANFRYKKGIDLLIDAFSQIENRHDMELHLIGKRNEEPDFERTILSKIKALNLKGIHIHGPKPRREVLKWMQASDGFVLPSRNEPFGISLIEAMACGLPVISTKSGGPEVILSDEFGTIIENENVDQLKNALVQMLADQDLNVDAQHQYIQEHFGKERYATEHFKLYDKLLNS